MIQVADDRAVRWLRSQCPVCLDIVSTIIKPRKLGQGLGDVFIDFILCPGCERARFGLSVAKTRRRAERKPFLKGKPVEAETRNAGGDTREYMPPSILVFIALLLGAMATESALSASESQRKIVGADTGANLCRPLTTSVLLTQGTRHGYSPIYRHVADRTISRTERRCAHFQCCAETGGATMRRNRLSRTEFARLWNASATVQEFASRLGIKVRSARTMASIRRKSGARLKHFRRTAHCTPSTLVKCKRCRKQFRLYHCDAVLGRRFCSRKCCVAAREFGGKATHGAYRTRLYQIWCDMKSRCISQIGLMKKYYSSRGICVFKPWREDFEVFRDWALSHGYRDDLELDRRNTNGNYEPGNCRFATRVQQMQNSRKRTNAKTSKFKGVSWCASAGRLKKWRVQLHANGKPIHVGVFATEIEAARAYDKAACEIYGEFAHVNFATNGGAPS